MLKHEEEEANRLLDMACPGIHSPDTRAVLLAAMHCAAEITHECGTPEATDVAILDTFFHAIQQVG